MGGGQVRNRDATSKSRDFNGIGYLSRKTAWGCVDSGYASGMELVPGILECLEAERGGHIPGAEAPNL
jgi:hypothetical protein